MPPLILAAAYLEGLSLTLIQGYLPLYVRGVLHEPSYVTVAFIVAVPALGTDAREQFLGRPLGRVGPPQADDPDRAGRLRGRARRDSGVRRGASDHGLRGRGVVLVRNAGAVAQDLRHAAPPGSKGALDCLRADVPEHRLALGKLWAPAGSSREGSRRAFAWRYGSPRGLLAAHAIACAAFLRDERRPPLETRNHGPWLSRAGVRPALPLREPEDARALRARVSLRVRQLRGVGILHAVHAREARGQHPDDPLLARRVEHSRDRILPLRRRARPALWRAADPRGGRLALRRDVRGHRDRARARSSWPRSSRSPCTAWST